MFTTESNLSKNIRILRLHSNYTEDFFAEKIEIETRLLISYENGEIPIPTHIIKKIANYFNIDEYDLYELDEIKMNSNRLFSLERELFANADSKMIDDFMKVSRNYIRMQNLNHI